MRNQHSKTVLEETPVSRLSGEQVATIEAHVAGCGDCRRAYEAARLSQALVRARATESTEAPPFFQTKVMAAIREQRLAAEMPAILRLWKAAGSWVSAMAVILIMMAGMSIFGNGDAPETTEFASLYSLENVVAGANEVADLAIPYDQVLEAVYEEAVYEGETEDGN